MNNEELKPVRSQVESNSRPPLKEDELFEEQKAARRQRALEERAEMCKFRGLFF